MIFEETPEELLIVECEFIVIGEPAHPVPVT
jgi:hypothetical protein